MRDGGRLSAAIGVVAAVLERRRPVRLALEDWGRGARYAGAKDRAAVSGLVLDVLRRRRSLAWLAGGETPGELCLAALHHLWGWSADRLAAACADDHGPGALNADTAARLEAATLDGAPAPVRGDYPDWMDPHLARVFGEDRAAEGEALARRAPTDLRVNTLLTSPEAALKVLAPLGAHVLDALPTALRVPAQPASERAAPVEALPEFEMGWFEVQDLGSQLAAACVGDIAGRQVLDYCAGGGGKSLAFAAAMGNTGRLFAYDSDPRRLTDTVRRARRAEARNLEVRSPLHAEPLADLRGEMDLVFVDAPCTGCGTWRRHPDAKWRLQPQQLARRMAEQDAVLEAASTFVKPGGRLVYATCSLLAEENEDRLAAFLARNAGFRPAPLPPQRPGRVTPEGWLRLTPRSSGTDGFFVAGLIRQS